MLDLVNKSHMIKFLPRRSKYLKAWAVNMQIEPTSSELRIDWVSRGFQQSLALDHSRPYSTKNRTLTMRHRVGSAPCMVMVILD